MSNVAYVTQDGLDKLTAELVELKTVKRKEVVHHIQEAKEYGDLSENSEYEQAKNEQAFVEGRISEIEETLRKAKVVKPHEGNGHAAELGCTIEVEVAGDAETYVLVGATEANPMKGRISVESPTGKALIGHSKGDLVVVQAPSGKISYKIKNVTF